MLGLDVCEFGGQVLELLWLTVCYRGLMADKKDLSLEEEDDCHLNYIAPAQKSLQELQDLDADDQSLVKYKQTLLGQMPITDASVPNVVVTKMTLMCDEAPEPITMDLSDVGKNQTFTLKEGVSFKIKINFKVNKEIVCGLRYHHVIKRKAITVDKASYMVGSYCPKTEEHEFVSPVDEAPKGFLARGHYQVDSKFLDDDKICHLEWKWDLNIKSDWK